MILDFFLLYCVYIIQSSVLFIQAFQQSLYYLYWQIMYNHFSLWVIWLAFIRPWHNYVASEEVNLSYKGLCLKIQGKKKNCYDVEWIYLKEFFMVLDCPIVPLNLYKSSFLMPQPQRSMPTLTAEHLKHTKSAQLNCLWKRVCIFFFPVLIQFDEWEFDLKFLS